MPVPMGVWIASIALQGIGMGLSAYASMKDPPKSEMEKIAKARFNARRARASKRHARSTNREAGVRNIVTGLASRSSKSNRRKARERTLNAAQITAERDLSAGAQEQQTNAASRNASSNTIKSRLLRRGGAG